MNGFIYFLWSRYGIKIGRTNCPSKRLKIFGVKLPFATKLVACFPVTDAVEAEAYYHNRHAAVRLEGEWFKVSVARLLEEPDWDSHDWRLWDLRPPDPAYAECVAAQEWMRDGHSSPRLKAEVRRSWIAQIPPPEARNWLTVEQSADVLVSRLLAEYGEIPL